MARQFLPSDLRFMMARQSFVHVELYDDVSTDSAAVGLYIQLRTIPKRVPPSINSTVREASPS